MRRPVQIARELRHGMWIFRQPVDRGMPCPHVHDQIEVLIVERGWVLHRQCGEDLRLERGHLIAFWSAYPHLTLHAAPDTTLLLIYLPIERFMQLTGAGQLVGHWLSRRVLHDTGAEANLRWAQDCLTRSADARSLARQTLALRIEFHLLTLALDHGLGDVDVGSSGRAGQQAITAIIQAVIARSGEPLTVLDLAKTAGLHPDYANRLFKRNVGISLWEFVLQVRVARAQHLLADAGQTVLGAGLASGFGSASRFHAVFRRIAGVTPHRYRQQIAAGELTRLT